MVAKKVFITGADGMLGSSICRELLHQNYLVKAMCFTSSKATTIIDLPIEIVYGDILNKDFLTTEMQDCQIVVHVAANTTVWPRRSEFINKTNIGGTKNVMEIAEQLGYDRMIHVGSASSCNHGPKQNPGNETNAFNGWKFGMDYIDSKYKAQEMLIKQFEKSGFPVVIINPTFMIGPFDSGPSSGQVILAICKNALKFYGYGGKNFVCSKAVAAAIVNAITLGKLGESYIAGGENLSYKEFFIKVYKNLNKKFDMMAVPNGLILMIGFIASSWARVVKSKPKISFGMALLAKENQYFSPEKAQKELNMPQTPIEEGIEQSISWFKANNYF